MPNWFSKRFKKKGRSTDNTEQECPLKQKGVICVVVSNADTDAPPIAGVTITVSGPQTQTKPTGPQGVAEFIDLPLGAYEVTVSPPQNLSNYNYNDDKRFESRLVGGVWLDTQEIFSMLEVFVYSAGTPQVKVAKKGDAPVLIGGATVNIEGPRGTLSATTQGGLGIADFGPRKAGKYSVKGVTLSSEDQQDYRLAADLSQSPIEFDVAEGQVGQAEVEVAQLANAMIRVVAKRSDGQGGIANLKATLSGAQSANLSTNEQGAAEFKELMPGDYTVKIEPDSQQQKLRQKEDGESFQTRSYDITLASRQTHEVKLEVYQAKVQIKVAKQGVASVVFGGVSVELTGPESPGEKQTDANGMVEFIDLPPGRYQLATKLKSEDLKEHDTLHDFTQAKMELDIKSKEIQTFDVEVVSINMVEPKIELDATEAPVKFKPAKAVAENIHGFPPKKADGSSADVVAVKLSIQESAPGRGYEKDAVLALSGAKATLWRDDQCKTPLEAATGGEVIIPNGELKKGYTIYLRGDEVGQAKLEFKLDESATRAVRVVAEPASAVVTIKASNRVTPYIQVEHLVVLCDQELWREQRKNDSLNGSALPETADRVYPDATRIELSAAKLADEPAYTGKGKLVLTPANVGVFKDEACQNPFDISQKFDFAKLTGQEPFKLWLRGQTAGKFTAKLELDASDDPAIQVDGPAEGEMGCVQLEMKLHHYKASDVNLPIEPDVPDATTYWNQLNGLDLRQSEMTTAEKAGTGRMLHVQDSGRFSRAKLVLPQVQTNPAHWPDAAKDYKIILDAADGDKNNKTRSGSVKLFDTEFAGTEIVLPIRVDLSTLKGGPKTYWVEGGARCTGWRGIRMSLGFDRNAGGPAKGAKMDADWGAFTIVTIKEVKCDVGNEGGQEKFVDGTKIFVNLDANGRRLKSVAGKRKAEVTATIEPALQDVDIHFAIIEHEDNYKIVDLPDAFKEKKLSHIKQTLKPKDRDNPKSLLHMTAKTDNQGKAKIETLETSQFAKHQFKIGAYTLQDPNHARFIHKHADLMKYEPVMSDTWLEVWRRLFYRLVAMQRFSGQGSYNDRFEENELINKMAEVGIEFQSTGLHVEAPYRKSIPDADTVDWVRSALGVVGDNPDRTQYLVFMDSNRDGTQNRDFHFSGLPGPLAELGPLKMRAVFDSNNGMNWVSAVDISYDGWSISTRDQAQGVLSITQSGDFKYKINIDVTARYEQYKNNVSEAKANDFLANVQVRFSVVTGDHDSGMSWQGCTMVFMRDREQQADPARSATHTFLHEIGHYVGLGCKNLPDANNTLNPQFYDENYTNNHGFGGYGQGPHCDGLNQQCVLWYRFKMTHKFCDTCQLALRARALHSPSVPGRSEF